MKIRFALGNFRLCRHHFRFTLIFGKIQDDKFSFAVAIFTVGGIVGSFSTGFLVTKFGRKNTQMINMFLSIVAGGLYLGAFYMKSSIMLIIARILVGAFAGLATGVCPMYILELSPASIRGAVGVLSQLFITIGLLTAQIIAFPQLMGKPDLWGWFFALTGLSLTSVKIYHFIS